MTHVANWKPKKGDWKLLQARQRRRERELRDACRASVYARDGGCCVRCGTPVKLKMSEGDWWNVANIHEKIPRSLGGSPRDPDNCVTLCCNCHIGTGSHVK